MVKEIYVAGGCFWGLEKYFANLYGIVSCEVGYANGNSEKTSYQQLKETYHAETLRLHYDPSILSLTYLLELFYEVIDPTSYHRQGADVGSQYRSGIYYVDDCDKMVIQDSLSNLQKHYQKPIVVAVEKLTNYIPAETYHQHYLDKNPQGYCHIGKEAYEKIDQISKDLKRKKGEV